MLVLLATMLVAMLVVLASATRGLDERTGGEDWRWKG